MNKEESYRRHLQINIPLLLSTITLTAAVILTPWHIGFIYPLVVSFSVLSLCYSHYKIQYHEIRTIIRIFIVIDCILLAIASPVALA